MSYLFWYMMLGLAILGLIVFVESKSDEKERMVTDSLQDCFLHSRAVGLAVVFMFMVLWLPGLLGLIGGENE